MARTVAEIREEYIRTAGNAGDMSYRIECFKQDLSKLHNRMLELNQEAIEAEKAEKAANEAAKQS